MCGIGGFLLAQPCGDSRFLKESLDRITAALGHRGPDNADTWMDGRVGLAHTRLSIIDLSSAGHQPMCDDETGSRIVFNGEIYNFRDLRRDLEGHGCRFRSHSDTEVILHGYRIWGTDVLSRLRGMFAFVLWDPRKQHLMMARDRIGKKPLYYSIRPDGVVFASEIKGLHAGFAIPREPDLESIHHYLSFQYIPAPRSAFIGVQKFPPAHFALFSIRPDGTLVQSAPERYWRRPSPLAAKRRAPTGELCEELLEHFRTAVKFRMISDVPVGVFLSGGVDSSAVVAMMADMSTAPVKTFSICFEHDDYDERQYARMVAERYGTDHHELVVRPDVAAILPNLAWQYDEPFADPSAIPTWCVSEMASKHVKVVLNGDGGDEGFFGYGRYQTMLGLSTIKSMPRQLSRPAGAVVQWLRGWTPWQTKLDKLAHYLRDENQSPAQRYAFTITSFMDYMKCEGYGPALRSYLDRSALEVMDQYFTEARGLVDGANWADFHTYLPDNLMVKVDIATMAHSLEARSPFLDHVLLEWAAALPVDTHMKWGVTKRLLKKALEPHLPKDLLYRPKMGFGCPIGYWLRGSLKELAYDTLMSESARRRGLLDSHYVQRLLDEHCSGTVDHQYRLWTILMMELWFQTWIDGSPSKMRSILPQAAA